MIINGLQIKGWLQQYSRLPHFWNPGLGNSLLWLLPPFPALSSQFFTCSHLIPSIPLTSVSLGAVPCESVTHGSCLFIQVLGSSFGLLWSLPSYLCFMLRKQPRTLSLISLPGGCYQEKYKIVPIGSTRHFWLLLVCRQSCTDSLIHL